MNSRSCLYWALALLTATVVLTLLKLIAWPWVFVPLMIALILIALGATNIQWNFFLSAFHRGNPSNRQIALTFDDGPHPLYTPQVLALLKLHNVQATFFCIGKHVVQYPQLAAEIRNQGHVVANHSFTHAATIDFHSKSTWLAELLQTDQAIADILGRRPRFFRPPYGITTPHLADAIKESGHLVIGWRVRPYDTLQRPPHRIANTILKRTKPGDIVLLHDTHDRIAPVLEQLLPELKRREFTMVTVAELIQRNAYANS